MKATMPFPALCKLHGLPEPEPEYPFAKKIGRRWRFDWAWTDVKVALEIDGGVFVQGRHSRGMGQVKDMEKHNHAVLLGWKVLRCIPKQINNGEVFALLEGVLACP